MTRLRLQYALGRLSEGLLLSKTTKRRVRRAVAQPGADDRESGGGRSALQGKTLIGWSEHVDLPDWGIDGLHAKVDTGARSSVLHVEDMTVLPCRCVRFHVVLSRRDRRKRVEVTAPILKWARVRSSTGEYVLRCFVRTTMRLGPVAHEIELSLVSRERMQYRMLIGRTALERHFVVDVSRRKALSDRPRRARRKSEPE